MKKIIKLIVIVVLIALIALLFFAGPIIKNAVNTAGPAALGVPVSVADVDVSLLQGVVRLNELKVGNPEGFDTENLFTMNSMNIEVSMASVLSDKIVVKKIEIIGPEITYERNLTESNIGALQKQLAGDKEEKPEDDKPKEEAKEKKEGKKVVIDYFVLDDCQVNLSLPGMGGIAAPLPLPKLELRDIGKDSEDGATVIDVVGNIFGAIFAAVGDVVMGSGRLVGSGVKAVGTGAAAVGGAAVDGAAAVGGAAVDGVSAVGKGIVNLFGGGDEEKENKDEATE